MTDCIKSIRARGFSVKEGVGMMLPVEEVCGGKGLVDKCPSSLHLVFLVIIHGLWASLRDICRAGGV
jgi:hypothetical protein